MVSEWGILAKAMQVTIQSFQPRGGWWIYIYLLYMHQSLSSRLQSWRNQMARNQVGNEEVSTQIHGD
jgi:hypothetical protein